MTATENLALAKLFGEKETAQFRDQVGPGKHTIDVTVRVRGALVVANDTSAPQTSRALSLEAVATALYFAGVTRERAIDAIARVALDTPNDADVARADAVAAIVATIKQRFAELPHKSKRGAVKATLLVDEVRPVHVERVEFADAVVI